MYVYVCAYLFERIYVSFECCVVNMIKYKGLEGAPKHEFLKRVKRRPIMKL